MKQEVVDAILERLDGIEVELCNLTRQQTHTHKLVKEIKHMAGVTQADLDAISESLATIKVEINKIGADLAAAAGNNNLNVDDLRAKVTEIAAQLQSLDDTIPEQP